MDTIYRGGGGEEGEVAPGAAEEERTIPPAAYMSLDCIFADGFSGLSPDISVRKRLWRLLYVMSHDDDDDDDDDDGLGKSNLSLDLMCCM